jgi:YgiT-type zinc finger domain-containing protein
MKCTVSGCPGLYDDKRVNNTYRLDGRLVVVRDIPVQSCPVCGDVLVSPNTARRIEALLSGDATSKESAEFAPVYALEAV